MSLEKGSKFYTNEITLRRQDSEREPFVEREIKRIDTITLQAADSLLTLDAVADSSDTTKFSSENSRIFKRYLDIVQSLEGMSSAELLTYIDPDGVFDLSYFSHFNISVGLPGAIQIELGTPKDLEQFRRLLSEGELPKEILSDMGMLDERKENHFAAQYFSSHLFKGDTFGVMVIIDEQCKDAEEKEKAVRHEYSHAVVQELIRPYSQKRIVDIDLYGSASRRANAIKNLNSDTLEALGITALEGRNKRLQDVVMGEMLRTEQFLLDELRAYTFNFHPLPPNTQITDADLTGENELIAADPEIVKKYYRVWLLHTKARLMSVESKAQSLAILGASVSLAQAERLLLQCVDDWRYSEEINDDEFIARVHLIDTFLNSDQYRNFEFAGVGSLISYEDATDILIPDKNIIDKEVIRRWGKLVDAPQKFQLQYNKLFD